MPDTSRLGRPLLGAVFVTGGIDVAALPLAGVAHPHHRRRRYREASVDLRSRRALHRASARAGELLPRG